jgi:hypothetical protein
MSPQSRTEAEPRDPRDRVHFNIEEAQADIYRRWARPEGPTTEKGERRIFDSITSMFVFSAAFAYSRGQRRPMTGSKRDVFRWQNLDEVNQTLLRSIALAADGGGVDALSHKGSVADIVEEYAAAGVDILRAELGDDPSRDRAVESLARLVCEMSAS